MSDVLLIGATFTASPLAPLLTAQHGTRVEFTRYNQLLQSLLAPDPACAGWPTILLVRLADLVRQERGEADELAARLTQRANAWLDALRGFAARAATAPCLLIVPSPALESGEGVLADACRSIAAAWRDVPGLTPLDWAAFAAAHPLERPFDPVADKLGHVPFSVECFNALAPWLAGQVRARGTPSASAAASAATTPATSLARFLERLNLNLQAAPLNDAAAIARTARLSHTAATFHLTGRAHVEDALRARLAQSAQGAGLHVDDRFGQYGYSGYVLAHPEDDTLVLGEFVLNCTVLGKQVEHGVLLAFARAAARAEWPAVALDFARTDGNAPACELLDALAARAGASPAPAGTHERLSLTPQALADAVLACSTAPAAVEQAATALDLASLAARSPLRSALTR
ncbi:fkbH domain protein [Burkholderia sp. Bp9002]|nr:fkbH domain protein [Burkholderia sp. Bp9125]RQS10071.1 fkbH domain protein [Burkholderia sp. Bp9002]